MKLGVILGSTHDIRRGAKISKWLMPQLEKFKDFDSELLDLKDFALPFFKGPDSLDGSGGHYSDKAAQQWAAKVAEMDAFIIITPEYDHGTSAALKNTIDRLHDEWSRKPVVFINYMPKAAGGLRAAEQLPPNVAGRQMTPLRDAVHVTYVVDTLDEKGNIPQAHFHERLIELMKNLSWWSRALKIAREQDQ